jgi:hypothetical protein
MDTALTLPAASVAVAERVQAMFAESTVVGVIDHCPFASAMPVPITVLPFMRLTSAPLSAVPVNVGKVSFVAPPLVTSPVYCSTSSIAAVMLGKVGAVVSMDSP